MEVTIKCAFTDERIAAAEKFHYGFYGAQLDERTAYSSNVVSTSSINSFRVVYSNDDLNLSVGEEIIECHELDEYLAKLKITSLLIDSTSLDIPELALLFQAAYKIGLNELLVLYIEPDDYTPKQNDQPAHEDFDLSEDIIGFEASGVPTITQPFIHASNVSVVFFLGFEGNRLLDAFETFDISSDSAKIIFGVPAFKAGWETRSFKKNIRVLKDHSLNGRIGYCSANTPSGAIKQLRKFCGSREDILYVVPIGTKPNSIGALIYLVENKNARLLYDQPRKKSSRSYGVGRQHLYKILF